MTKDVTGLDNPYLDVLEEEEEIITLDFANEAIYQKEEAIIIKEGDAVRSHVADNGCAPRVFDIDASKIISVENIDSAMLGTNEQLIMGGTINCGKVTEAEIATPKDKKPVDTFGTELSDLLLNSFVSKAVGSLLDQYNKMERDVINQIVGRGRIGELSTVLEEEVYKTMNKRYRELKASYVAGVIKYENIPLWARQYVKRYVVDMVGELASILDKKEEAILAEKNKKEVILGKSPSL